MGADGSKVFLSVNVIADEGVKRGREGGGVGGMYGDSRVMLDIELVIDDDPDVL